MAEEISLSILHLHVCRQCRLVFGFAGVSHGAKHIVGINNGDIVMFIVSHHAAVVGMDISFGRLDLDGAGCRVVVAGDYRVQCRPGGAIAMFSVKRYHGSIVDTLQLVHPRILHIGTSAGIGHQFAGFPTAHLVVVGAVVLAGDAVWPVVEVLCHNDAVETIGCTFFDRMHIILVAKTKHTFVAAIACRVAYGHLFHHRGTMPCTGRIGSLLILYFHVVAVEGVNVGEFVDIIQLVVPDHNFVEKGIHNIG